MMPNLLSKNLHLCIPTMIKRQPPSNSSAAAEATTAVGGGNVATGSPFYMNTYNSLYDSSSSPTKSQDYPSHSPSSSSSNHQMEISDIDDDGDSTTEAEPTTPDFTTIYATDRFFVSCPGQSNSIIHSSSSSTSSPTTSSATAASSSSSSSIAMSTASDFSGVEAVETDSPDPYNDFRRSMQEVVEAHGLHVGDVRENWNGLHELLLCYLCLNPKDTHKFIVGAFADLLGSLVPPSTTAEEEVEV